MRRTGYFGSATSLSLPFASPAGALAAQFRPSATDADNHGAVDVAAGYVQDQLVLSPAWQLVGGVRVDRFAMRSHNNRSGADLSRDDRLVSPRLGAIFKPVEAASLYASYSVSQLPSAGDQFSSLTVTTQALEPERFVNYEVGARWEALAALALSGALFSLDRSNSQAHDPNDVSRTVQTGAQRTTGFELSATTAGREGATVPLVPAHTLSLWNRVQPAQALGVGLGVIHQALPRAMRMQLNLENLLDTRYFPTSQGNNDILPGAPRSVRVSVTATP